MLRKTASAIAAILVSTMLAACGGGGPEVSKYTFDLQQAWVSYLELTGTQNFIINGTITVTDLQTQAALSVDISGTGVETRYAKSASSFEGTAGFSKIYDQSATYFFTVDGTNYSDTFQDSYTWYFDNDHALLGSVSADSYMVVTNWFAPPIAARVGDKGDLFTADVWESVVKAVPLGSVTYRYEVLPDSKTSVLLKLSTSPDDSQLFRVTTTGQITPVSARVYLEGLFDPTTWLTMDFSLIYQ